MTVETLRSLLRGEISAAETYATAIEATEDAARRAFLRRLCDEHGDAIADLRRALHDLEGESVETSGMWGHWAKAVENTAAWIGDDVALRALREGERIGVRDYRGALDSGHLPHDVHARIQGHWLPRTEAHVAAIDAELAGEPRPGGDA